MQVVVVMSHELPGAQLPLAQLPPAVAYGAQVESAPQVPAVQNP